MLAELAASPQSKRQTPAEIGIPRGTYYNWARQRNKVSWETVRVKAGDHGTGIVAKGTAHQNEDDYW